MIIVKETIVQVLFSVMKHRIQSFNGSKPYSMKPESQLLFYNVYFINAGTLSLVLSRLAWTWV